MSDKKIIPGYVKDLGASSTRSPVARRLVATAVSLLELETLRNALRRIRYIAGHKSTTPGSDYDRIYQEATAALPAGDLLRYPNQDASLASLPEGQPQTLPAVKSEQP